MNQMAKRAWIPIIIVLLLAFFAQRMMGTPEKQTKEQVYSDLVTQIEQGKVQSVVIAPRDQSIEVTLKESAAPPRTSAPTRPATPVKSRPTP